MVIVRLGIALLLLSAAIMLACSSDDNPIAPKPPDNPVVLDTGGLAQIPGNPSDTAFQILPTIPSHPAPQDKMDDDGFMRTRLDAKLHPQATLQQLNDALAQEQAVVTFANPGWLTMALRIPEVSDRAEADTVATRLMATGAFLAVFPAYAVGLDGVVIEPGTASATFDHLSRIKMPAAWNARGLAERQAERVTVLVADKFVSATPHGDIPAQRFLTTSTGIYEDVPLSSGKVPGNHGFHVSGILAASLDDDQGTGAHPGNTTLIDLQCLTVGGQLFPAVIQNIWDHLPPTGRFVLNTSLGTNQSISSKSKLQRAYEAIDWRVAVAADQNRFLHCTSSGNRGQETDDTRYSHWNSPFTMAAHFATPQEMAPIGDHTVQEVANLVMYAQQMYSLVPEAQNPLTNVIIVGNSEYSGAKASSSCAPADVRVVGEEVYNVCAKADVTLNPNDCSLDAGTLRAKYSGTSMATPQIAGLAAYLWNLKPELTVSELISIITSNYREDDPILPGRVDAYGCVTSLDHSLADCPVRRELLDVAGATPVSGRNSAFDENDLQVYFDQIRALDAGHNNQTISLSDNSRYDLNGNGTTTIDSLWIDYDPQRFDLDVNSPPHYSLEVTQTIEGQSIKYDETELSDLDILCYYAYSPLYTGSVSRRTELCLPCLGEFELTVNIASEVNTTQPELLTAKVVRKPSVSEVIDAPGIKITVDVLDGSASPTEGTTDANGEFTTEISADGTQPTVEIHVEALLNDVLVDSVTIAPTVISDAQVTVLEQTMEYSYEHYVVNWNSTSPTGDYQWCDSVLQADTVALPTQGSGGANFTGLAGPCESDGGATCQVSLDSRHQWSITSSVDSSALEYVFGVTANHFAQANEVMDDQAGYVYVKRKVIVLFEVSGSTSHMNLQFGTTVRDFYPVYNPTQGNSVAYGKIDVRMFNEDDGVTPPFGMGEWILAQPTSNSYTSNRFMLPGKYRLELTIDDALTLYNFKNMLPHITEGKHDVDYTLQLTFTPAGGNEM